MGFLIPIIGVILAIIIVLILFYKFWFLRDPLRLAPSGNNIVSPADGSIIQIKTVRGRGKAGIRKGNGKVRTLLSDMNKENYMVTIFMTPFNVHYQRAPYEGRIIYADHTKGTFKSAEKPRPENENNQILIRTRIGNMKVIQIAGLIARRIECFVKKNQNIKKGNKLGIIKLGSQAALIMPKSKRVMLRVRKGDKVKAGETILADVR